MKYSITEHITAAFQTAGMILKQGLAKALKIADREMRHIRDYERYIKYGHEQACARAMAFDDEICNCPEGTK